MDTEKTHTLYSSDFQSYCDSAKILVDSDLQNFLPVIAKLKLQKQIDYALRTRGKRLRPTLVFLSGESLGASRQKLQKLALSVELMHLATLVHDDILDEDLFRRNSLAVYARWSVKDAVLVGDLLASLSLSLCKSYKREILDVMIDTCMQLSDGEYSDVELAQAELNEEDYFKKIRKKSASIFKAACKCGSLAANGSRDEINALSVYGENYGLAYQIRDDILDAKTSGSDMQPDVNKFRATLPIINVYERADREKKAQFERLLAEKTQESLSVFLSEVQVCLEKGALDYCANKVDEYVDRAIASLDSLKENSLKDFLREMVEALRTKEVEISVQNLV